MAKRPTPSAVSLSQLASGVGIDEQELRARMKSAGMDGLIDASGALPVHALDRVVAAVRAPRPPAGKGLLADAAGLAAAMQGAGVRRLEPAPRRPERERPKGARRPAASPPGLAGPESAVQALRELLAHAEARLEAAEGRLQQATRRAVEAEAREAELVARLALSERALGEAAGAARAEVEGLSRRLTETEGRLAHAEARRAEVVAHAPDVPAEGVTLIRILASRGLLGEDEAAEAVRGLIETRRWSGLAAGLRVESPERFAQVLVDRLVLCCGGDGCAEPPGFAVVRVPPSRCEICGGGDLARALRRLGDALLLNGHRRAAVAGLPPGWLRLLKERVDPRVELLAPDVQGAPLRLARGPTARGPGELVVEASSLAAFAEALVRALEDECAP